MFAFWEERILFAVSLFKESSFFSIPCLMRESIIKDLAITKFAPLPSFSYGWNQASPQLCPISLIFFDFLNPFLINEN